MRRSTGVQIIITPPVQPVMVFGRNADCLYWVWPWIRESCHGRAASPLVGRHGSVASPLVGRHGSVASPLVGRHGRAASPLVGSHRRVASGGQPW